MFSLMVLTACGNSDQSSATKAWENYDEKKAERCEIQEKKADKIKEIQELQAELAELKAKETSAIQVEQQAKIDAQNESKNFQ